MLTFLDNTEAQAALTNGGAKNPVVNDLAAEVWRTAFELGIGIWFERVQSEANIADPPDSGQRGGRQQRCLSFLRRHWVDVGLVSIVLGASL